MGLVGPRALAGFLLFGVTEARSEQVSNWLYSLENWRSVPAINDRLATRDDLEAGRAAFYAEDCVGCTAHPNPGLPALIGFVPGALAHDQQKFDFAIAIQMEHNPNGDIVVVGYVWPDGTFGAVTLDDVQWIKFVTSPLESWE